MANIGIIRCEKNAQRCPLTNCIKSLRNCQQGFADYSDTELTVSTAYTESYQRGQRVEIGILPAAIKVYQREQ